MAEERRRNQLLQHSSQVLEAKNHVLEARLEELHIQVSDMERRSPRPSRSTPAANGNSGGADGSTTPQTGWWGTWWGAPAADAAPALARAPLDPEKEESPPANRDALQKELDEWNDVVGELSHTKLTLAEVQGKLAAALRDVSRLRDVNDALNAHIEKLTEQGCTPYGSDITEPS